MFNFANIIKAVVTIAAVANTVIRKVAEKNPVVARAVKTFDNFVSSFTGSGKDDNDASDVLSLAERKQREKDRKQQELEQKAKAFDSDIAQAKVGDDLQDEGNLLLAKARHKSEIRKDIDALLQGKLTSAELQVAAVGNPVLQSMLKMWQFERSHFDKYMGDADTIEKIKQKLVASFALAEEDTAEITEAALYYKYKMGQDVPTEEFTQLQLEVIDLLSPNYPVVQEWRFNPSSVSMYEYIMEQAFGYEIEFAPDQTDESKRQQLDRLAESNLEIIRYLDDIGLRGSREFRQHFAEGGQITVHLGADDRVAELNPDSNQPQYEGHVPRFTEADRYNIFLGSGISTATITHEFFHQLDRVYGNRLSSPTDPLGLPQALAQTGLTMASTDILLGRASQTDDFSEIFADYGMTAVLHGRGYNLAESGVFRDENENEPIGWNYAEFEDNAQLSEEALADYFRQIFSLENDLN